MILDILFFIVLVLTGIYGFRRGFVYSFIHTADWIIAFILSFMATGYVKEFLLSNTNLAEEIVPEYPLSPLLPELLKESLLTATSNMIFTLLVFIIVFIVIKILLGTISFFITRSDRSGFMSKVDGIFGMLFGLIKGLILLVIIIAVILPVVEVFLPQYAISFGELIDSSIIVSEVYNYNPLMLLLQNLIVTL